MLLFLWIAFVIEAQAAKIPDIGRCQEKFRTISVFEVRKIFSDKKNYIKYQGQEGYRLFVSQSENASRMNYIFNIVSKALGKRFETLGWQAYHGSVEEFNKERGQILNPNGSLKEKYKGQAGYAKYAEEHHDGNMLKTFQNVSAVLGGYWGMKEIGLNWKHFQGNVSEYYKLLELFQSNKAMDFEGIEGQIKVANEIFNGHYTRTYKNVSALRETLLGNRKAFTKLNWSRHLKEFNKEGFKLLK